MLHLFSLLLGSLVGFSTGLSGAGGSLLAIPFLVSCLAFVPRDAFATSLAATAASCLVGVIPRFRAGLVEARIGLWFAAAGMVGAPLGTRLGAQIPERVLLGALATIIVLIAARMLQRTRRPTVRIGETAQPRPAALFVLGIITGVVSGVFGIGCGFIIVPGLIWLGGISIHRAVSTTLLVAGLISASGAAANFVQGRGISQPGVSALFVTGAILGVVLGGVVAGFLTEAVLRRVFSGVLFAVGTMLVFQLTRM